MEYQIRDNADAQNQTVIELIRQRGLANPEMYKDVIKWYDEYRQKINGLSLENDVNFSKEYDFFEVGFGNLESVSRDLDNFTRLHMAYKESLNSQKSTLYGLYIKGRDAMNIHLGKSSIKVPSIDELIDESARALGKLKEELAPAHEAVLEVAESISGYNMETLKRLIEAGRYHNEVEAKKKDLTDSYQKIANEKRKLRIVDNQYEEVLIAYTNLERIVDYWRNEGTKTEKEVNFRHPETKVLRNYEKLCISTVHYCERVEEYVNEVQRHLNNTKGVGMVIKATRSKVAAIDQIAIPLTQFVLSNADSIGEAVTDMARIATKPEIDGELTKMMNPVLQGFVTTVRKIAQTRDITTSAMARKILYTPGY